ncbi:YdcF family protein [Paraglaciecola sp. 25GB23A]|uniref:YdcF family protein n=1 Tax=Paraglaciecola sp. 25GB23A TaxID=3156068 RepID=UPI0032B00ADB
MTYPSVVLIKPLEDQYPVIKIESEEWRNTGAIVVLACNYFEDENLPFLSRWPNCSLQRNMEAVLLYKAHRMPVYLAGDILGYKDKVPQAVHNRDFLIKFGVKAEDIHIVTKGKNTETEVRALLSILKTDKITLVTSASHLPRAMRYFTDKNIQVVPVPVEHLSRINIEMSLSLPSARSLYRSERAIHEYLGLVHQNLFL